MIESKWREAAEQLAQAQKQLNLLAGVFVKKYYPNETYTENYSTDDAFWVSNETGGVFEVAGTWYTVDHMIEAIELNATFDQLYDYQDDEVKHELKETDKPMPVSFKEYVEEKR